MDLEITFMSVYIYSSRGRLLHGRHFTYKSITGDTAITFVSTGVEGAFATEEHPYAAHGPWLQVRALSSSFHLAAVSPSFFPKEHFFTSFSYIIFRPRKLLHSAAVSFEVFRKENLKPKSNGSL